MYRHVQYSIARSEKIAYKVVFGRVTSSLFNEVLEEVYSSDIASSDKATDQWYFHWDTLSFPHLVRQVSKHLLATFAALVFGLVTKRSNFNVVYFDAWNDSTGTFYWHWADLGTVIMRNTCLQNNSADKVLADHEDGFPNLMISGLWISRTLKTQKRLKV